MLAHRENPEQILADAIIRLIKNGALTELSKVIDSPIAQRMAHKDQANKSASELGILSDREREVLEFLSRGYLIKEIAGQMGISFDTTRTYIRRIYEKMHVHSRTQAVAKYLRVTNSAE
jgi:DNA-binding NarL/FixJ family response regulator